MKSMMPNSIPQSVDSDVRPQERIESLMREAVQLYEQNRLEEALLVCEGILALDSQHTHALSLKGLIHERRGQIGEAIYAYQRVLEIDPLRVAERARLESLRRRKSATRAPSRPIWLEAMPAIVAFFIAGGILLFGLIWLVRSSTVPPSPQNSIPQTMNFVPPTPTPPATTSRRAESPPAEDTVPPVVIDPSKIALAPARPPAPPLTGEIPTLPTPLPDPGKADAREPQKPNSTPASEILPDVKVEERDPGVYEITVHRAGTNDTPREDPVATARRHQMAGNYREAIDAYLRALPTASSLGYVHQQIATCYLRLNEKANARQHFLQAIQAYEQQIRAGRDRDSALQGISACQDGLKLCEE